jgi:hypothetical protein
MQAIEHFVLWIGIVIFVLGIGVGYVVSVLNK